MKGSNSWRANWSGTKERRSFVLLVLGEQRLLMPEEVATKLIDGLLLIRTIIHIDYNCPSCSLRSRRRIQHLMLDHLSMPQKGDRCTSSLVRAGDQTVVIEEEEVKWSVGTILQNNPCWHLPRPQIIELQLRRATCQHVEHIVVPIEGTKSQDRPQSRLINSLTKALIEDKLEGRRD